ncbi:microcystin degradation protein MlrC [Phyllobacterium myrsinacearum]|uniref:M81 family metallopeptidase n=1 Tax=Phyllobacterium myrsinacearum TaxID=28101 RepID=UPI0010292122|nr:M81 family metallopeptidase [Phyllobacterium myrsinacearum]RZS77257.1 microcystin degradation protein MlrC [Phyllobacterium myrsinacearum]
MRKRVLIAGFQHETNTFAPTKANYSSFERGEMYPAMARGQDLLKFRDVNIPIGGFIRAMEARNIELVPVVWAGASPSAHVTEEAFERIACEIVLAASANEIDGVYLDLHGAMIAEHCNDGEGELLKRVREVIGRSVPLVASLDLHANVTHSMFASADALVAYRTYPHVDMSSTGERAATLLTQLLETKQPFHSYYRRLPFLIPINAQATSVEPANGIYRWLAQAELGSSTVLSFAPGFPASDFPECGGAVWGVGVDADEIRAKVDGLFESVISREAEWRVDFLRPVDAVEEAKRLATTASKPIIIADTQDNPGAGGNSDTMGLVRALLQLRATDAAVGLIVDQAAAQAAHQAGEGAVIEIALGGKSGIIGDGPLRAEYRVEQLSNGICRFDGPMLTGMIADVGPSARLSIGGVEIAVSSFKTQMIDRNLFRMVGIEPEAKKILAVKSSVHFRADFEPISGAILVAKSPGPVAADPQDLPWKYLSQGLRLSPLGPAFVTKQ